LGRGAGQREGVVVALIRESERPRIRHTMPTYRRHDASLMLTAERTTDTTRTPRPLTTVTGTEGLDSEARNERTSPSNPQLEQVIPLTRVAARLPLRPRGVGQPIRAYCATKLPSTTGSACSPFPAVLDRIAVRWKCVPKPDDQAGFADRSIHLNRTGGAVRHWLVWHIVCVSCPPRRLIGVGRTNRHGNQSRGRRTAPYALRHW
jgi:hypothetical protein